MNVRIMRLCLPEFIKKKKLKELFRLTADAFQTELPELRGLSFRGYLAEYARFSGEQAENYLRGGRPAVNVGARLYKNSFAFGRNLRKSLHIMTWEESIAVLQTIYEIMGIEFQYGWQNGPAAGGQNGFAAEEQNGSAAGKQNGSAAGQDELGIDRCHFSIKQCFFSGYYSAEVCRLISALDEGLAAGLSGGGRLCFRQRITEGGSCCTGYICRHSDQPMIQTGGCS